MHSLKKVTFQQSVIELFTLENNEQMMIFFSSILFRRDATFDKCLGLLLKK